MHTFTNVRTNRLHMAGVWLITLIRHNITFITTDIHFTINTHTTDLEMVNVHKNNTKHITIANMYIPPRDSTSTHYKRADTDTQKCIQHITNIPQSVLTGDMKTHFTLCHSYTDDYRGQLIADGISNSDHITLNTKHKQRYTTYGNAPKRYGSYLRSKTHIQHTHSQHLSTRTHTSTNNKSTHRNSIGHTERDAHGFLPRQSLQQA